MSLRAWGSLWAAGAYDRRALPGSNHPHAQSGLIFPLWATPERAASPKDLLLAPLGAAPAVRLRLPWRSPMRKS